MYLITNLLVLLTILFTVQACNKEDSVGTEYTIPIDSIAHPDTITSEEILVIKYYGILGLSDCYSFNRFDVSFDADIINTTAIGLYIADEDCKDDTLYIKGEEAKIYSLPEGDFTILVNLPRNQILESKVHVISDK